jgi:receptor expression-enhancing protein 5/6
MYVRLTYWVVYSFFTVVEVFADVLLYWYENASKLYIVETCERRIPLYYVLKVGFLVYLMSNGAETIYNSVLKVRLRSSVIAFLR